MPSIGNRTGMMRDLRRFMIVALLLLIAAAIGCGVWFLAASSRMKVVVRNGGESEIRNVHLVLRDLDGVWMIEREAAILAPGEEIVIGHRQTDLRAESTFTNATGRECVHREGYIDLWTGEGWLIEIQPDGTVKSGYLH
jgi:hypothetical protein